MKLKLILASLAMICICSCSPKVYPSSKTDSVRVEIRERIDTVVATITIEKEVEKILTRDSCSRLENTYAVSEAGIQDGLLYHSLETKPQSISKPVYVTVRDTLIVEKQAETIVQEVERKLTWWQRFKMGSGVTLFVIVGIALAYLIFRVVMRVYRLR